MNNQFLKSCLLFLSFILSISINGQVQFENAAHGFADNQNSITLSNFSATGSSNLLLVLQIQGMAAPTSVQFDGVNMDVHVADRFWYLALGDNAITGDLVITFPSATTGFAMAMSFSGASQFGPLGTPMSQNVVNSPATNNLNVSSKTGDLVVDFLAAINDSGTCGSGSDPTLTVDGAGQTGQINQQGVLTGLCAQIGASTKAGAASVAMSWTATNHSINIEHFAFNISQYTPPNNVGIGTTTPHPSAALEIESTDQGLLIPGLTTEQRDAISSPAEGLIIYNITDDCFNYYAGDAWYKDCGRSLDADTQPLNPQAEGGTGNDLGLGIASDLDGNIYIVGAFEGTLPLGGTNLISPGDSSIFIVKFDQNGSIIWAKKAGGMMKDVGYGIDIDDTGNLYISGSFQSMATFGDTTLTSSGDLDGFIAKYNTDGDFIWVEQFGGTGEDEAGSIFIDPLGNVLVTGYFNGMASFDGTSLTSAGDRDVFIAKYDSAGSIQWAKKGGGSMVDVAYGITTDTSGNVIINGWFEGMATFESTTLNSDGDKDVFTAKYNSAGILQWVRQGRGTSQNRGYGVVTDWSGNIFVTGFFVNEIVFGSSTLMNPGSAGLFVVKYDPSGNIDWIKSSGGSGITFGYGLTSDNEGNVYVTGNYDGIINIDTATLTSVGNADILILKYALDGTLQWAVSNGGTSSDYGNGITVSPSGIAYVTGSFEGQATFGNTTYTSFGGSDFFLTPYNLFGEQNKATPDLEGSMDNDTDPKNEIQNWGNLPGIPAPFADGSDDVNDADSDPFNEIQTLSSFGNTVTLTNGGGSIVVSDLDEVGLNSTNFLPKWNGSELVASSSVFEDVSGNVGIGTVLPNEALEVDGAVKAKAYRMTTYTAGGPTSSSITLNGLNIITDFPDLTHTFTLTEATTVTYYYQISMDGGGFNLVTNLDVNGVVKTKDVTGGTYWSTSNQYTEELSPGTYTVKVTYRSPFTGINSPGASDYQNRVLQVTVHGSN